MIPKNAEPTALLKSLKRPGDAATPTLKKLLIERYDNWKNQTYFQLSDTQLVDENNGEGESNYGSESDIDVNYLVEFKMV